MLDNGREFGGLDNDLSGLEVDAEHILGHVG